MSDAVNVNVLMPRELLARLDRVAGDNWRSRSGEIRRAVEDHVAAVEARGSDHFREPAQMVARKGGAE